MRLAAHATASISAALWCAVFLVASCRADTASACLFMVAAASNSSSSARRRGPMRRVWCSSGSITSRSVPSSSLGTAGRSEVRLLAARVAAAAAGSRSLRTDTPMRGRRTSPRPHNASAKARRGPQRSGTPWMPRTKRSSATFGTTPEPTDKCKLNCGDDRIRFARSGSMSSPSNSSGCDPAVAPAPVSSAVFFASASSSAVLSGLAPALLLRAGCLLAPTAGPPPSDGSVSRSWPSSPAAPAAPPSSPSSSSSSSSSKSSSSSSSPPAAAPFAPLEPFESCSVRGIVTEPSTAKVRTRRGIGLTSWSTDGAQMYTGMVTPEPEGGALARPGLAGSICGRTIDPARPLTSRLAASYRSSRRRDTASHRSSSPVRRDPFTTGSGSGSGSSSGLSCSAIHCRSRSSTRRAASSRSRLACSAALSAACSAALSPSLSSSGGSSSSVSNTGSMASSSVSVDSAK
mmetsp:Transcript_26225/g.98732  ORF Transcript_26225/g.98732 Transcript_26225/m.98732 type:complete len:460 (+) Transcript_26225:581-1960(+)